jgi:hypothetical protein
MVQASIPQVGTLGSKVGNRILGTSRPSPFRPTGTGRLANCNQYTIQQVLGLDLAVGWFDFLYHGTSLNNATHLPFRFSQYQRVPDIL